MRQPEAFYGLQLTIKRAADLFSGDENLDKEMEYRHRSCVNPVL